MKKLNFSEKWVLVTGASSGLGKEMAWQLAKQHKAHLVLIARRKELLQKLKHDIEAETGQKVIIRVADLSISNEVNVLLEDILVSIPLYAAILNAGVTYFGKHLELSNQELNNLIHTNVIGVTNMISQIAKHFEESEASGGIMVVSSLAAIYPTPYQAVYAGTKAFLLNFSLALSHELLNKEFSITVFLPGGIATEMTSDEKFDKLRRYLIPAQKVALEGLQAFKLRKAVYIPGFLNRIGSKLSFLLPKNYILKKTAAAYMKSLGLKRKISSRKKTKGASKTII